LPRFADYELLDEIGRGGMGVVYKARQISLDRHVALKMILFGPLASAEQIRRFRTEASAAAALQHPNIVAVHEVGVHEGQHYLVMDLVDGPNLAGLIKDKPLPAKRAAGYLKSVAEAIHFAHEHGILHRDLKPSNVLVGSDDRPRVADFGLARRLGTDSSLTLSGQMLGSPNYMPPEQAAGGGGKVGRPADIYGLGAILYHLLTTRPPFQAETIPQTIQLVTGAEPLSPGCWCRACLGISRPSV
jgi:serine/threonine protein kinase